MKVIYHPEATLDVEEAYGFFERREPGLGADFRDDIDDAVGRIRENPDGYAEAELGFRRCVSRSFRFWVIFGVDDETIFIQAVVDSRRDPDHWLKR